MKNLMSLLRGGMQTQPIKEYPENEEKQKQHLEWIYQRLIHVHKENPNYDYMLKFKEIINNL